MEKSIQNVLEKLKLRDLEIQQDRDSKWAIWDVAETILGYPGRMLSGSKTAPKGQRIIWNANICTKEHGKIWYGDFNITLESDKLAELAKTLGVKVYVLYEHDARFKNELNPLFSEAVYKINPSGKGEFLD